MRVTLIFCGDTPAEYFNTAAKEYEKRISAFSEIETIKIKPEFIDENKNPSSAVIYKALDVEGEKILSAIPTFPLP